MEIIETISRIIRESIVVKEAMLGNEEVLGKIAEAASLMKAAVIAGHKIMWAGNGGSAADAQHLAAELVNKFRLERRGLPSIALTTDTSVITSISNDYGYERIFARQIEALGEEGDIFVGISTSGNSLNLLEVVDICRNSGIRTIALTGGSRCKMDCYDLVIKVPCTDTPRIQESQILLGHILCEIVEKG